MGAAKPRGDRALLKTTIIALTVTFHLLTSLASAERTESEIDQQMRLLKDTNPAVRAKAIRRFVALDTPTTPDATRQDTRSALCAVIEVSGGINVFPPDVATSFSEHLDPKAATSTEACTQPLIHALLRHPDERVRELAADAFGRRPWQPPEQVFTALNSAVKDSSLHVRMRVVDALAELQKNGHYDELGCLAFIAALGDENEGIEEHAAEGLVKFADFAVVSRATDLIPLLDKAEKALEGIGFSGAIERVRSDRDILKAIQNRWYETLWARLANHRAITAVAAVYFGLFGISVVLLSLWPLALLWISEKLAVVSAAPRINRVLGVGEAVLVFGLFRHHPRVLNAWVAKYIPQARTQFNNIATVKERDVYVTELPVKLDGKVLPSLAAKDLRQAFSSKHTRILIWGEGGSGKTSLACQIARWAMSADKSIRPFDRRMLPILIEQDLSLEVGKDKSALVEEIRGQLREMTGSARPPSLEFVRGLLQGKNLLLIVDGLSELNDATRNKLRPIDPDFDANALIVTSRLEENLDRVGKAVIRPQRIEGNRLSSFMDAYLSRCDKRELFDDGEFFEGCKRLSRMVGQRNTTVLLAKLYAEQMIAAKEQQENKNLPEDIPDLMLEYVNRINRQASVMNDRAIHAAVKATAWECLRQSFRPKPAPVDSVLKALGEGAEATVEYLEHKLHLVETTGAARDRVRFVLDPLAEYMAGLHVLETCGSDRNRWLSTQSRNVRFSAILKCPPWMVRRSAFVNS